ncbi:SRPBCC domain-containing protein [Robiginitalea sp. M366]|nr:SRPBCC domain-containing protein [Robiginitalea aestuariiviva]MDG1572266.1 SRPBCC domain-containing protein [Robiginitalea aestuariiviva]
MSYVPPIEVSQVLPCPPQQVWDMLTDPIHMKQWFFEQMPDFKAEVGFETNFVMPASSRDFHAFWRVRTVVPGQQISVEWTYKDIPGWGEVTFELLPAGTHTRVVVRNSGLESFPQDIPEFKPESCRGGWEYFLNQRLKAYAEGQAKG